MLLAHLYQNELKFEAALTAQQSEKKLDNKPDQKFDQKFDQKLDQKPGQNVDFLLTQASATQLQRFFQLWHMRSAEPALLYFHGPSGTGKTALMRQIQHLRAPDAEPPHRLAGVDDGHLQSHVQSFRAQPPLVISINGEQKVPIEAHAESASAIAISLVIASLNQAAGLSVYSLALAELERMLSARKVFDAFSRGFQARTGLTWQQARDSERVLREDIVKSISAATQDGRESAEKLLLQATAALSDVAGYLQLRILELAAQDVNLRVLVLFDELQFRFGAPELAEVLQKISSICTACKGALVFCGFGQTQADAVQSLIDTANTNAAELRAEHSAEEGSAPVLTQESINHCALHARDALALLQARVLKPNSMANLQLAMFAPVASHPFSADMLAWLDQLSSAQPQLNVQTIVLETLRNCRDLPALALLTPAHMWPQFAALLPETTRAQVDEALSEREGVQAALLAALALAPLAGSATVPEARLIELCQIKLGDPVVPTQSLAQLEAAGWMRRIEQGAALNLPESAVRHVGGEITSLSTREKMRVMADLVYNGVLNAQDCVDHANGRSYGFNRLCDAHALGSANHELTLMLITPLSGDYADFDEFRAVLRSAEGGGQVVMKLANLPNLNQQLNELERSRGADLVYKRAEMVQQVRQAMLNAEVFVAGKPLKNTSAMVQFQVEAALTRLIDSVYPQVALLSHPQSDVLAMIRVVLGGRDLPAFENADALVLVRDYLEQRTGQLVSLNDVVQRFRRRPLGWPDLEVVLLAARLVNARMVSARIDAHAARPAEAAEAFTNAALWSKVMLVRMAAGVTEEMLASSELAQRLFGTPFPLDSASNLAARIRAELEHWRVELAAMASSSAAFSGVHDAREALSELRKLGILREVGEFLEQFVDLGELLEDIGADLAELRKSRQQNGPVYALLRKLLIEIQPNLTSLSRDAEGFKDIERLRRLQTAPSASEAIGEIESLCERVLARNFELIANARDAAMQKIDEALAQVQETLGKLSAAPLVEERCTRGLLALRERVEMEHSHSSLIGLLEEARQERDVALDALNRQITTERPAIASQAQLLTVVRLSHLSGEMVLEQEADLDVFFDRVRTAVVPMLLMGMRVRLE